MPDEDPVKSELEKFDEEYSAKIAELEAQLKKLDSASDALSGVELDHNLHDELEKLESRAQSLRCRESVRATSENVDQRMDAKSARSMGLGLSIAYGILGLPIVGFGLGLFLDSRQGTDFWKPLLVVSGAVGGIAFALYQLKRNESQN